MSTPRSYGSRRDPYVEQHFHAPAALLAVALSNLRPENSAPAVRKTASAARRSILKSSTNSSRDTPSASQSKSCCTGKRLPRKQGVPLMRSGSTQTASSRVIVFFIRPPPLPQFQLVLGERIEEAVGYDELPFRMSGCRLPVQRTRRATGSPRRAVITSSPGCQIKTSSMWSPVMHRHRTASQPSQAANSSSGSGSRMLSSTTICSLMAPNCRFPRVL